MYVLLTGLTTNRAFASTYGVQCRANQEAKEQRTRITQAKLDATLLGHAGRFM